MECTIGETNRQRQWGAIACMSRDKHAPWQAALTDADHVQCIGATVAGAGQVAIQHAHVAAADVERDRIGVTASNTVGVRGRVTVGVGDGFAQRALAVGAQLVNRGRDYDGRQRRKGRARWGSRSGSRPPGPAVGLPG